MLLNTIKLIFWHFQKILKLNLSKKSICSWTCFCNVEFAFAWNDSPRLEAWKRHDEQCFWIEIDRLWSCSCIWYHWEWQLAYERCRHACLQVAWSSERERVRQQDGRLFILYCFICVVRRKASEAEHARQNDGCSYEVSKSVIENQWILHRSDQGLRIEIIEDIFEKSFALASEIDTKLIFRRYKELNHFRSLHYKHRNADKKICIFFKLRYHLTIFC